MRRLIEKKKYREFICVSMILCFLVGFGVARSVNLAMEIFSLTYRMDTWLMAAFCGVEFGLMGGLVYLLRIVDPDEEKEIEWRNV